MAPSGKKVIYAALAGNALIAVTKFIAAAVTGSSAMLSEGIHSLVDTGNQVLLLHGIRQSQKPPDKRFPFGYGKEIYFWSFVVAILIFAVGAGISLYEGIAHILHPKPVQRLYINYIVLGLSVLFEGAAWLYALREFTRAKGERAYLEAVHKGKDPTLFVVLFEDSAALLGLLAALAGTVLYQATGNPLFDSLASVVIAGILGATAIWLAYETKGLLIGESANQEIVNGITTMAGDIRGVNHVNEILTLHMGPDYILVNLSLDFEDCISADILEEAVSRLDQRIRERYPRVKKVFVEAEARTARLEPPCPAKPPQGLT